MKNEKSLSNILRVFVITIIVIVVAIAVGAWKLEASGLSVILGVLIAGMLTISSTILNHVLESSKKERESVETVRRDAQRAAIEVMEKLKLQKDKDINQLGEAFKTLFGQIFDCFEQKRKEQIGKNSNDKRDRQKINTST